MHSGTAQDRFSAALYQLLLSRSAGAADVQFWGQVLSGEGRAAVVLGIQQAAEYRQRQVSGFYSVLLNRQTLAPKDGVQFWVNGGLDLLGVSIKFGATPEFFSNG